MPRAKATGGRDSPLEKNNRRAERSWLANERRLAEKERKEREGRLKKKERTRRGNKGKKKYWKKRGERERSRAGRERHVEKVVPLLFFSFSRTHRRSLNPIPLILKQTNTYRMYHGGK